MSAKELTVFTPESALSKSALSDIAKELSLEIDKIPPELNLSYQFSAQKGSGKNYLLIEYKDNDISLIQEIAKWERPSNAYKKLISDCKSSITIHYREQNAAKDVILKIGKTLENGCSSKCVAENGLGCLLKLDDLLNCLQEPQWSWEKEKFPELTDVAISEWR